MRKYRLARKMKNISLTAAAKELGVSQPTLSAWESERKSPSVDSLIRMSEYYGVTVDFLLGLTEEKDTRMDYLQPISPEVLPALHGTPVFYSGMGWAFVDIVAKELHFADGGTMMLSDAKGCYLLPHPFAIPMQPSLKPVSCEALREHRQIWVEPISSDNALREELRGWYHVKDRFVENEFGNRFYFDNYQAKWLGFADAIEED